MILGGRLCDIPNLKLCYGSFAVGTLIFTIEILNFI